jgi:transposase-like protein
MVVTLRILGSEVTFEIVDENVLAAYMADQHPVAVLEYLAECMGIDKKEALRLIEEADEARVRVDTLQVPDTEVHWEPGVHPVHGYGAEGAKEVLSGAVVGFLGELASQEDKAAVRGKSRRRSRKGEQLVSDIARISKQQGISIAEASRRSGVPRETLRDARRRSERLERQAVVVQRVHEPRQRFDSEQRAAILAAVARSNGNASKAARELGLPDRTVREMRQREREATLAAPHERAAPVRHRYADQEREALLSRMGSLMRERGLTATEAGRQVGVADRTARGWVHAARRKDAGM